MHEGDAPANVADGLARVRARVAAACAAAGRDPAGVGLVAVSKFQPPAAVADAIAAGQLAFGENRVGEAAEKFAGRAPGVRLHLIGALQTNKVRDAVRVADRIEVLDRARLADALADAAGREGRMPELLVQVNTGDEAQKAGIARADADAFLRLCRARFGASLRGLMCIPPADADPAPHFRFLAKLAAEHGLPELSMGMSGDLEAAIAAGATAVRVGTAIFGGRPVAA